MSFSRVFDVKLSFLHIPGISFRLMALFLLLSGAFVAAFRDRIGKYVLAFTMFFMISIPLGVWRSGSIEVFTTQWLTGLIVFVATAALIPGVPEYVRAARTMAYATVVLAAICILFGTSDSGRLFLDEGRFSNPNEMAQALLMGMPFLWAVLSNSSSRFFKLAASGGLMLMLYVISRTGSRGALVSLVVIGTMMFVRASLAGKVKVLVSVLVLLSAAVLILPENLKVRYMTFFSTDPDAENNQEVDQTMLVSAVASANSREDMFKRSLVVTLHHPLLGVGPGNFPVEEDRMAKAEGKRRGAWLGTHNTFTEVSSECGIPAFLFYCAIVVASFRKTYSLYRRTRNLPQFKEINSHALALNYSLIAFVVTGLFVHAAYTALLPVLAGLTISLVRSAEPVIAGVSERSALPSWRG